MSPLSPEQISDLQQFWPASEGVNAIPLDAAAFDQKLFLALHQPMVFSLRNEGIGESAQETEEELLAAFLRDQGSGATISVLEGQSGVGKSHAIRWLEARISDDPKYVVIWVPRNRSAKWVLMEILHRPEFRGEEFTEIRNRLTAAVDPIGVVEAGWSLRVKLALALQQEPGAGLSPDEREFFNGFASELAEFVSDHNIWRLPPPNAPGDTDATSNPLLRLARHLVGEKLETRGIEDRLFVEADLDLPPAAVERAGPAARDFWKEVIKPNIVLEDGETPVRRATVGLLNRLLDEARAGVLGLDVTPIAELFVDLRRMLKDEGKELVLLIEDFTVMAGLQRSLLDIMVTTATTVGGDTICPIRTALALTPGYMHGEALPTNVRTRANMYTVEDRIDEEDALSRYEALTGSFLNVARLTPAGLAQFGSSASFGEVASRVAQESEAVLVDFGRSTGSNHWLFPLNSDAVRTLARQRVVDDNRLIYNPRLFMKNVLVSLLEQRTEFLAGDFPNGASGLPDRLSPIVQQELAARVPPGTQGKYRRVLATWGGRLRDWDDACRIPAGVFDAFGLTPLEGAVPVPAVSPPTTPKPVDSTQAKTADLPWYHDRLQDWMEGEGELHQELARELRKSVADTVTARLPRGWPGLPAYPASSLFASVYIPRAKGNRQLTQQTAFVAFSTAEDLEDPDTAARHHLQAEALLRWGGLDKASPKPDLFEVVSRTSAFARRVKDDAACWLFERPADLKVKRSSEVVDSWISAQLTLAEAQGEACPGDPGKRLQRLFPDSTPINNAAPPEWQDFLKHLNEVSGSGNDGLARAGLLAGFAAFQGAYKTPYAIDAAAIWDALGTASLPMPQAEVMRAGLAAAGTMLVTSQRTVMRMTRERLEVECRALGAWMGQHTPGTIVKALGELAHAARNSNVGRRESEALLEALSDFEARSAQSTAKLIQSIAGGTEDSKLISTLGRLDWNIYRQFEHIHRLSESFMDAVESSRQFEAATGASVDHVYIQKQFRAMLDSVNDLLEKAGA